MLYVTQTKMIHHTRRFFHEERNRHVLCMSNHHSIWKHLSDFQGAVHVLHMNIKMYIHRLQGIINS